MNEVERPDLEDQAAKPEKGADVPQAARPTHRKAVQGMKGKGGDLGLEARLSARRRIDQGDFVSALNQGPG
jgi:hypothetical protein